MKSSINLILILFFALIFSQDLFCSDLDKYKQAYEYVKNSKEVELAFKKFMGEQSLCVSLSDEIIYLEERVFENDIMNHDFSKLDSLNRIQAKDSLLAIWSGGYHSYNLPELDTLDLNNNCSLILFFTKKYDNRIFAQVLVRNKGYKDYDNNSKGVKISLEFLFYYKKNKLDKVYSQTLLY